MQVETMGKRSASEMSASNGDNSAEDMVSFLSEGGRKNATGFYAFWILEGACRWKSSRRCVSLYGRELTLFPPYMTGH